MAQHETMMAASNFLVPNATFIAELVAFVIILGILGKYVLPPVQKAMHERQEVIRKQLDDAEEARTKLAEAQAEYQRALTEARTQAAVIRDNARADAQRIGDEMREQATQESARIVARGEEQLANQRRTIVRELRGEVGKLAVDLATRIVGDSLSDEARSKATVDRFLAELESTGSGLSDTEVSSTGVSS
jgi:F-type H+-transporting ATPase subunit b